MQRLAYRILVMSGCTWVRPGCVVAADQEILAFALKLIRLFVSLDADVYDVSAVFIMGEHSVIRLFLQGLSSPETSDVLEILSRTSLQMAACLNRDGRDVPGHTAVAK